MTAEVAQNRWESFCERVQEFCQGARVSIGFIPPDAEGTTRTIAHDVLLHEIALDDKSDPCNTNLVIQAGLPNEKPVRHLIVEPIHILLKNEGGGDRYNHLEIHAENGITTVLFHPGLNPRLLEGVEL